MRWDAGRWQSVTYLVDFSLSVEADSTGDRHEWRHAAAFTFDLKRLRFMPGRLRYCITPSAQIMHELIDVGASKSVAADCSSSSQVSVFIIKAACRSVGSACNDIQHEQYSNASRLPRKVQHHLRLWRSATNCSTQQEQKSWTSNRSSNAVHSWRLGHHQEAITTRRLSRLRWPAMDTKVLTDVCNSLSWQFRLAWQVLHKTAFWFLLCSQL